MIPFTGDTAFKGAKYLEAETNKTLVDLYFRVSQLAQEVNRTQDELRSVIDSNSTNWTSNLHLHRADVVATRAADFERAHAKYLVAEQMFVSLAHDAGVGSDDILDLVSVARTGR